MPSNSNCNYFICEYFNKQVINIISLKIIMSLYDQRIATKLSRKFDQVTVRKVLYCHHDEISANQIVGLRNIE